MNSSSPLGLGIGWRFPLASAIERRLDLGFVEILAEDFYDSIPQSLKELHDRGVIIVPHAVSLSLGGAEPIDPARVEALGHLAQELQAPLVSEHLAFVRAGGLETGHLLPLPRTREMLDVLVENIRAAEAILPVPLALENISALFDWPGAVMDEAAFIREVLERTEALLLLDIENVYANARNLGIDRAAFLDRIPLDRIAYVHVAGGKESGEFYHDTHAMPVPDDVLSLLEEVCARTHIPGAMLERDDAFPPESELNDELDAIAAAMHRGQARRVSMEFTHHSEVGQ